MKNYYDILGIPSYEDNQDAILLAYKNGISKLSKDLSEKASQSALIDLNEAYLMLSDVNAKKIYDYDLSKGIESEEVTKICNLKRQKANEFVSEKFRGFKPHKKKRLLPAILCGLFLFGALGTLVQTCAKVAYKSSGAGSVEIGSFTPNDDNWSKYSIANSFTIDVPNTMELRSEYDPYTEFLHSINRIANAEAVFQQANLSSMSSDAMDTYSRIMVQHCTLSPGDVESHDEASILTSEDKQVFKEMVDDELGPYSYVSEPTFRWVDISGTKAIEAKYKRQGDKGPVVCRYYLLPNYDELVKIIISYRECDAHLWQYDLENVIRTFRWTNPK